MILERKKYIKEDGEWINNKSWFLEYETYEYTAENVELVTKLIQDALEPKFLSTQYREENKTNPLFGHCYHSTQAMYYFMDTDKLVSMSGVDELDNTHWWLQDGDTIIDVTGGQYDSMSCDPPYDTGKPTKWYGWKNRPHKRSMTLMQKIQESSCLYLKDMI